MTRKYIDRKNQNDPKNDEWNIIVDSNKDIDRRNVFEAKTQKIFLNSELEKNQTNWDKTKDATRNALDRAGNTSQYMKYVNDHMTKQHSEINRIKKLHEKFNQEINLLQNNIPNNVNDTLDKKKNSDKQNLYTLKHSLLEEETAIGTYLNQLRDEILRTEKNLQTLDEQLQDVESRLAD